MAATIVPWRQIGYRSGLPRTDLWFIFSFFFRSAFSGGKGSEPGIGSVRIPHDVAQWHGWCIAGRREKE